MEGVGTTDQIKESFKREDFKATLKPEEELQYKVKYSDVVVIEQLVVWLQGQ
jgi:hypothetical protein